MPTKYLKFTIENQSVDLSSIEETPISISYKLEDKEDFQVKTSGTSFDIKVPATVNNDQVGNTFHNPGIEDLTPDEDFKRPRKCVIEANGYELLVGKAFLKSASYSDVPLDYTFDCYGDNGDWVISLKESTLFDFLKHISFVFSEAAIMDSWAFDGRDEAHPLLFAPVRYKGKLEKNDNEMSPLYFKPSLSAYWLIYWGFKSLGYRVQSDFFNTDYFRRAVMPWTWGNFLYSDGSSKDNLLFNATNQSALFIRDFYAGPGLFDVSNDNVLPGFDSNNVYSYNPTNGWMNWTYLPVFNFGIIAATFEVSLSGTAVTRGTSEYNMKIHWYKNGVEDLSKYRVLGDHHRGGLGKDQDALKVDKLQEGFEVVPGDVISAQFEIFLSAQLFGSCNMQIDSVSFKLAYTRYILGSTIDFTTFTGLKNYKFLDFLKGIVDCFNLSVNTDCVNKIVVMEPTHPYSLTNDFSHPTGGYFNGNYIDWEDKQDLSKVSTLELFSDYEREVLFKFKEDANDGILKVVQDRNKAILAQSKYVLPDRFKSGKKEVENSFFSPVMHFDAFQWTDITGITPQMICLIPENISNTSESAAQNTFQPKLAWYKGEVSGIGWNYNGSIRTSFPFMFAVNYMPGGENDPIFSFSDERIGKETTGYVLGRGLMRRFYWQRMAIMRNGVYCSTWFHLNNLDVTNLFHREHKILQGQKWELVEIKDYRPLMEKTTSCYLRKWSPISEKDRDNTFPSPDSVILNIDNVNPFDTVYKELKCLSTDIPKK